MMIKIMRLISMKLAVITLLSLFGCCGHSVFASKRAGSSNSERLITLINGRRPSHPTNLGGGGQEAAAGHVNTRRTAKSVSDANLDTPVDHIMSEARHHLPHQNFIINRHHEGDIFATTGKKMFMLNCTHNIILIFKRST